MAQRCLTPGSTVNCSDREEARRTALNAKFLWNATHLKTFHKDSRDTESNAALKAIKAMHADVLNSFDVSMI